MNTSLIFIGKTISLVSKLLNLGHGSTWPGHVALLLNKNFIRDLVKANSHLKIILIAGTNGKTTTGKLIQTILESDGKKVFQNEAGANLLNGIASSLLLHSNILLTINYDYAIFEVDEATFPLVLKEITPNHIILLNLFRDQLDRYGEVNTIASKWRDAIGHLPSGTTLIINADDPQIVYLGRKIKLKTLYYGLINRKLGLPKTQHATDSTHCPVCNSKLIFDVTYYSHLGIWQCSRCAYKRPNLDLSSVPFFPLVGVYNKYNTIAAVLFAKEIGITCENIEKALKSFSPAFGRQEIIKIKDKKVQVFLSKNPASFNESLRTIKDLGAKTVLLVLNDRIPDGLDVSWIWDVDTEELSLMRSIIVSGDRAYDMGLRIKYSSSSEIKNEKLKIIEDLQQAIMQGLEEINRSDTLYILPTYSAMLEVRKILTGKKIL